MPDRFEDVDTLMGAAVRRGVFPGAALIVSKWDDVLFHQTYGLAEVAAGRPVTRETLFDLSSLTKPLATTPAVMALSDRGRIKLSDTLGTLLPEMRVTDKADITIEQLLNHTAGMPAHREYFRQLRSLLPEERTTELRRLLAQEPLVAPPGRQTVYSDLGFMILAWVLEHVAGLRLDRLVEEVVYRPLRQTGLIFVDLSAAGTAGLPADRQFAATENCPWRQKILDGEVHDDNAFVLGGIAGHAGLFGTAAAVCRFLTTLFKGYHQPDGAGPISHDTLVRFLTPPGDGRRALGFDVPAKEHSSAGRYFSSKTVGHLGFTGTSFWLDLEIGIGIVLLTNRVHPSRRNEAIREFRPLLHDTVMKQLISSAG